MDEGKLSEQIGRAARASGLLNDETFNEAIDGVKQDLMNLWEISKDPSERERIWLSVNLLERIKSVLVAKIEGGKSAQRQLEDLASGRTRKHFGVV